MSAGAVAERYAQAIFELGIEGNELSALADKFQKLAEVWSSSPELRAALENPVVSAEQRTAVLGDVAARLGISGTALRAVQVMALRGRLAVLPQVGQELTRLSDEHQGILRATIVSAQPLSESYYLSLKSKLEGVTGKKVVLRKEQDPSLLGGVVAHIGDAIIDGSVRGRLSSLERQLLGTPTA